MNSPLSQNQFQYGVNLSRHFDLHHEEGLQKSTGPGNLKLEFKKHNRSVTSGQRLAVEGIERGQVFELDRVCLDFTNVPHVVGWVSMDCVLTLEVNVRPSIAPCSLDGPSCLSISDDRDVR